MLKVEKDVTESLETLNKPFAVSCAAENGIGPFIGLTTKDLQTEWTSKKEKNGSEAVNKILKTKITLLQKEIDDYLGLNSEKDFIIKELQLQIKNFQDQEKKTSKTIGLQKLNLEKNTSFIQDLKKTRTDLEFRNSELSKELELLSREKKNVISDGNSKESRLNRALNEIEKLKILLSKASSQVKESQDTYKSRFDVLFLENQKLIKQKGDLLLGFKKQGQLIDVLKRQKMHLESVGLLGFTEQEFLNIISKE